MNEAEWLACADPQPMLEFLQGSASDRRLRLFCCACCRRVWDALTEAASRAAVEVGERYADGLASPEERAAAEAAAEAVAFNEAQRREEEVPHVTQAALVAVSETVDATIWAAWAASEAAQVPAEERRRQCDLLRDLFSPFRPVAASTAWLAWNDGTVRKLAQAIYDARAFERLPILADALEEAGCDNADILSHCRGSGPHARGCWPVDLLLGKE
jgi:hypothetical protein